MGTCSNVTDLGFVETIKQKMRILGARNKHLAITNQILTQMSEERKQLCFSPKPQAFYKSSINPQMGGKYTLHESLIVGQLRDGFIYGDGIIMDLQNIYLGNLSKDKPQGEGKVFEIEQEIKAEMAGVWNNGILEDFKIEYGPRNIIQKLKFTFAGQKLNIVYQDGCTYVGKGVRYNNMVVKNDVGKFTNPHKNYEYEGEWLKDKRHGKAKVFVRGSLIFKGTFEDDRKKKGKLVTGGYVYDGEWDQEGTFSGKKKPFDNQMTLSN